MKELSQIKSVLPFREIPNGIGRQRILRALEEGVTTAIMNDIQEILAKGLGEMELASFIETLQGLHKAIQDLSISATKSTLSQLLRFLLLVIENRLDQLKSPSEVGILCEQISRIIGHVPILNAVVVLPDPRFLPVQYQTSILSWADTIWKNPSRESREEKLEFFTRREAGYKMASVRLHLMDLDQEPNTTEALSYSEADFCDIGNLQADHLQPSEHIVKRQMELVAAMNLDPLFKAKVLHEAGGKGYFKEQETVIYGTKRFYLEYHNCIDNLWFISTAAGTRKSNQDPIEWLEEHERFGAEFFNSIGGKESINCLGILYTTHDGVLLAKAARIWFQTQYAQEITTAGYILHQIKGPLLSKVKKTNTQPSGKQQRIKLMAEMVTVARLVEERVSTKEGEHFDQSSSPNSSDAEITEKNLAQMSQISVRRMGAIEAEIEGSVTDYTRAAKRRRKGEKSENIMDTSDDDTALRSGLTKGRE